MRLVSLLPTFTLNKLNKFDTAGHQRLTENSPVERGGGGGGGSDFPLIIIIIKSLSNIIIRICPEILL